MPEATDHHASATLEIESTKFALPYQPRHRTLKQFVLAKTKREQIKETRSDARAILSLRVVVASGVALRHERHLREVGYGTVSGVFNAEQP